MQSKDENQATLNLTADEALVLFEMLKRWSGEEEDGETPSADCFSSTAECAALNSLLSVLEVELIAPFSENYEQLLRSARDRLKDNWDYATLRG